MSETTNLKLFKHDNPSTNENQFDVNKALNQNWDKLDEFSGEVNDKVIEIEDNIEGQELDIGELQQKTEQIEENVLDIQQGQETQNTEIANLKTEVQELNEDIKANSIIEETEKTKSLYIDDANASRGKVNVFGNMEQEIREGYNELLQNKKMYTEGKGITVTYNNDGTMKVNGTATADIDIQLCGTWANTNVQFTLKAGTHKCKLNTTDATLYIVNNTTAIAKNDGETLNLSNALDVTYVFIRIKNGTTIDALIKPLLYLYNNEEKEYEQYGASPSFDYRSEIKCLQENVEIKHTNKNIVEEVEYMNTSKQFGIMCKVGYTIKEGEKYIISFDTPNSGTDCYLQNSNEIKLNPGTYFYTNLDGTRKSVIVTATETGYFKNEYGFLLKRTNDNKETGLISNLMIEKWSGNDNASDYKENKKETITLDIQQDMVSPEDDYFDLERKKEVHGWKKIVFDGVNNKFTTSFAASNNTVRVLRYNGAYWDNEASIVSTDVKSTHFKTESSWAINTIYGKYTTNGVALQVVLDNNVVPNIATFNNMLKEKYDAGEPVIVYFKDEEPTELDLTDTQIQQLEKLNKLRFYEGVNNIMTLEDIALIQAQYSVNIQTKINNLISTQLNQIGGI